MSSTSKVGSSGRIAEREQSVAGSGQSNGDSSIPVGSGHVPDRLASTPRFGKRGSTSSGKFPTDVSFDISNCVDVSVMDVSRVVAKGASSASYTLNNARERVVSSPEVLLTGGGTQLVPCTQILDNSWENSQHAKEKSLSERKRAHPVAETQRYSVGSEQGEVQIGIS